ncbi:hypothetical protein CAEBREN_14912 [Caenorhabditis brenneri]|uniref:Uncharacterized protein n=1 Tax=Caenorhabditis brenneri TaxID=135651 RepID=G0N7E2_CAEBE|nr:hypothetical protein CAEBREN_14912 [Caenorhabditis brenneri]
MKLCLAIFLTSFLFIETHGSRVKRGLSADEQKKFLDELNKDRKRVAQEEGIKYVPMEYDVSLEKEIVSGKSCWEYTGLEGTLPLGINDVAEEIRKTLIDGGLDGDIYQYYFHPSYKKIGCSKEAKCTQLVNKEPKEFAGKTIE